MIDEKMFYIAPEVEVICFAPVETVATSTWNWPGTGQTGSTTEIETPVEPGDDSDGEADVN